MKVAAIAVNASGSRLKVWPSAGSLVEPAQKERLRIRNDAKGRLWPTTPAQAGQKVKVGKRRVPRRRGALLLEVDDGVPHVGAVVAVRSSCSTKTS